MTREEIVKLALYQQQLNEQLRRQAEEEKAKAEEERIRREKLDDRLSELLDRLSESMEDNKALRKQLSDALKKISDLEAASGVARKNQFGTKSQKKKGAGKKPEKSLEVIIPYHNLDMQGDGLLGSGLPQEVLPCNSGRAPGLR